MRNIKEFKELAEGLSVSMFVGANEKEMIRQRYNLNEMNVEELVELRNQVVLAWATIMEAGYEIVNPLSDKYYNCMSKMTAILDMEIHNKQDAD